MSLSPYATMPMGYSPYSYPLAQQTAPSRMPLSSHAPASASAAGEAKDPLRDTLLRYLGYTNEFGECGKDLIDKATKNDSAATHKWISRTYKVVKGYVGIDAAHKTFKGYKKAEEEGYELGGKLFTAAEKGVDAALFQAAASLYGPAFAVATFRDVSKNALIKAFGNRDNASEKLEKEIAKSISSKKKWDINAAPEHLKQLLFRPLKSLGPVNALQKISDKTAKRVITYVPMTASVALIPFLIHPIDSGVNKALDVTYRPMMDGLKRGIFGTPPKSAKQANPPQPSTVPTFGRNIPPQNAFSTSPSFANWGYLA